MRRRTRGARAALLVALAAVFVVVALLSAGCGRAEFEAGSPPDVPAAADGAGLVVLDRGTASNYYPGGDEAHWYVLGRRGSEQAVAVVSVLTFDSRRSRDAAARDLDNARRHGSRVGGLYTTGNAVVLIHRISDKGAVRLLDEAMREAGMK